MAWLKGFTYDGIDSLDYDLYITSGSVYDAPERVVDMIKVPGRNGNLAIDRGKFENIDVEYNVYTKDRSQTSFAQNIRDFRNELCSRHEYLRLTDDYNSDEFRLGIYKSGLELDADIDRAGAIKLTFDCKPQRFLTAGETERSIPEWSDLHTDSGSLVTVDNSSGEYVVKSLSAGIVPQQDLNGYDNPWAGGAGKNKLPSRDVGTVSLNGLAVTYKSDGSVTVNGTATANTDVPIYNSGNVSEGLQGSFILNGSTGGSASTYRLVARIRNTSASTNRYVASPNGDQSIEATSNEVLNNVYITVNNGTTLSNKTFYPMLRLSSVTDATYAPYENICPITGFSSTNVTRAGKNLLPPYSTSGGTSTSNGITFTYNSNGSITASGTATANASSESPSGFRLPPGTYKKNAYDSTNKVGLLVLKKVTSSILVTVGLSTSDTFTLTEEDAQYELVVRMRVESGATLNSYNYTPIIRLPDTTDASELYNGNTYSVSFGSAGTVYGGTLDVVSGQLTVTHAMLTLNTAAMNNSESYPGWKASGVRSLIGAGINQNYQNVMLNVGTSYSINTNSSNDIFILQKTEYNNMSQSDWIALAIDVQAIIPLATPLTYQLTATQVAFLLGTNNIWSNTGDIQIEYGKGGNTLFNPTLFDSRPLIELTGAGTLGINNYIITITGSGKLYIDCDTMEAYTITGGIVTSANNRVSLNTTDYPVLRSGINNFTIGTGISNVKITPRWWRV